MSIEILHQEENEDAGVFEPYDYVFVDKQQCRVYEVTLPPAGRVVKFRELTVKEFESCLREGKEDGWAISQAGLRRSILTDNGLEVTYEMVMGGLLGARFRLKELMILRAAWDKVNMLSEEDMAVVRELRVG